MKYYFHTALILLSLLANCALSPIFLKWYQETTGIQPSGLIFVSVILGLIQLILLFLTLVASINGKSLRDFIKDEFK